MAALIQDEMKKNLKNTDRVAKQADKEIYLLKTLQMPSALVEVGFLSNPAEAALLRDPAYQKKKWLPPSIKGYCATIPGKKWDRIDFVV